jgi:hypothetical protein
VTEPPITTRQSRYRRPPASPAVKTSSPCLPPRDADRAVGGIRAGIENSGRRASATNDSTPIPTIRPKSQQFVATARSPPCPTGAPRPNDPGISCAPLRRNGVPAAAAPVNGRVFRRPNTGPDSRTTGPERSRVPSRVMQEPAVVRERYGYSRWWAWLLVEPAELVSFVMSQRMLGGIRERAERAARSAPTVGPVPSVPRTPRPTAGRP